MTADPLRNDWKAAMQWFGLSWGAPVNSICPHTDIPVGSLCAACRQKIQHGEHGVTLVYNEHDPELTIPRTNRVAMHAECLLQLVSSGADDHAG